MTDNPLSSKAWTVVIVVLLLSIGLGIAAFVYRSTTQIREALAEEILEQQHDVSTIVQEYSNVMLWLERKRLNNSQVNSTALTNSLATTLTQLEIMRSNYSFARLDGAAKANTYVKPILEDIQQWTTLGMYGYDGNDPFILEIAAQRLHDRYPEIRNISAETDEVANELISEQTDFLDTFRNSLLVLLFGFAMLSLTIATLLIRQRNLQTQLGRDQVLNAQRLIEAETRGRHQAEDALLGSEQFLRATLNSLHSNIAILDQDGIITAVNEPWIEFVTANSPRFNDGGIGYHFEQVFRSTAITDMEHAGIDAATVHIDAVLTGQQDAMFFEYPCHRDDQRHWSLVSMSTFHNGDKRHSVLVQEDVTERKRLEERDRRSRAKLAHVSRLTTAGELASGLAHELNQPLTAITHNCDAVMSSVRADSEFDSELLQTVQDISEQAQHAGGIIRSMRHLVRKDSTDMVPTDINTLVKETVRLTGPEAREKGVNVTLLLADDLPMPTIDPMQIQQVLVNLERNSVEAMWQDNSTVKELTVRTHLNPQRQIQVCISDTGPGIEPEFNRHLFSAFQTTKADGMGLGLSISRTIVEEHDGRLWMDPDAIGVTIFCFTIPTEQE